MCIRDSYSDIKNNLFKAIKKSKLTEKQTAQLYILSNDMMQDILQSLYLIIESCDNHIKNSHKPLTDVQINSLQPVSYTHLDVYKRQDYKRIFRGSCLLLNFTVMVKLNDYFNNMFAGDLNSRVKIEK